MQVFQGHSRWQAEAHLNEAVPAAVGFLVRCIGLAVPKYLSLITVLVLICIVISAQTTNTTRPQPLVAVLCYVPLIDQQLQQWHQAQ